MNDLVNYIETERKAIIQKLYIDTEDTSVPAILTDIGISTCIKVDASGVQKDVGGQILISMLFSIHIAENCLQKSCVWKLLFCEAGCIEIESEISNTSCFKLSTDKKCIRKPCFLPAEGLCLFIDIANA